MKQEIVIIKAPSNLGLKPPQKGVELGVVRLPDALEKTGLYERLNPLAVKLVPAPDYVPEIDTDTGMRNAQSIRDYSVSLADVIQTIIGDKSFPIVIGGDCSILCGAALALRRTGRYGLLFVDGHTDFQTPETSITGGVAGMDLALVTGYGANLLSNIEGYKALIAEADVIAFGFRDMDNPETYYAPLIFETDVQLHSLDTIRQQGIHQSIEACIQYYQKREVKGVWLHIDVDVLNDDIMPAVDSRQEGGMSYEEFTVVIQIMLKSGLLSGLQLTILDPNLDPDGSIINEFANRLYFALNF